MLNFAMWAFVTPATLWWVINEYIDMDNTLNEPKRISRIIVTETDRERWPGFTDKEIQELKYNELKTKKIIRVKRTEQQFEKDFEEITQGTSIKKEIDNNPINKKD